jgi:hypothetical protein
VKKRAINEETEEDGNGKEDNKVRTKGGGKTGKVRRGSKGGRINMSYQRLTDEERERKCKRVRGKEGGREEYHSSYSTPSPSSLSLSTHLSHFHSLVSCSFPSFVDR